MLKSGIYEQVLNKLISKEIDSAVYIVKKGPIEVKRRLKFWQIIWPRLFYRGLPTSRIKVAR